ncbi:helix-turn-helix domain-containing protein [Streptomyces pyxinae]|uniref:helix-turn-helix domain-containing protein n=1 Tax=Streptomyces pyxinae TaxID=2970734 RepID=UPI003D16296A
MTHQNTRHTTRFTVIGNHLAQHARLSLLAIGLSVHIQSLPTGTPVDIRSLAGRFPEGTDRIAAGLRELEAHGYLRRERVRDARGRVVTRTVSCNQPGTRLPRTPGPEPASAPEPGGRASAPAEPETGPGTWPEVGAEPELRASTPAEPEPRASVPAEPGARGTDPAEPEVGSVPAPPGRGADPAPPGPEWECGPPLGAVPPKPGRRTRRPVAPLAVPRPGFPAPELLRAAAGLLAGLHRADPRLLLSARDTDRLAPGVAAWLERDVAPEAVRHALTAELPGAMRYPAALLAHRLTAQLPPAPAFRPPPAARPDPIQTCDGCDRAFRAPAPGRCRACPPEHPEPPEPPEPRSPHDQLTP